MNRDFDANVAGIEDGIVQVLIGAVGGSDGYAKAVETYSGELDSETIRDYLEELRGRFPLFLVCYTDGEDVKSPAIAPAFGQPRIFRHRCTFTTFVASDDARGEKARRRGARGGGGIGVYRMIADVRKALAGRFFRNTAEEDKDLFNVEPMTPAGVEFVARMPEMALYAVHHETEFEWIEPDRRQAGKPVTGLIVDVHPTRGVGMPGGLPGVEVEVE